MSDHKYGQKIMVRNNPGELFVKRIHLATIPSGVLCVLDSDEEIFEEGSDIFSVRKWNQCALCEKKVKSNTDIVKELIARGFRPDKIGNWVKNDLAFSPNYLFDGWVATKPDWMLEVIE